MSKREDFHVYSSTTHHRHRNHTAVSGAKYCMSVDMANMMIHGTSELEVGKKSNLPFGQGNPRLQERCLEWIPIKKINAFEARRNAIQNWSDNHMSDSIFNLKSSPKVVQNPAPRGPIGLQNPFRRPPGGQAEEKSFFDTSRTPQGPLLGSHLGVQNRSKRVLEAFPRRM